MRSRFRSITAWAAIFLMCIVPMSCLVEKQGETFILNINLPNTVETSDSLAIFLVDTEGTILDSLFFGEVSPAMGGRLRKAAPHYDGGEAIVHIQEYAMADAGDTLRQLATETRIRINSGRDINETLPIQEPDRPGSAAPGDTTMIMDTAVMLRWSGAGRFIDPQPFYKVFIGPDAKAKRMIAVQAESLRVDSLSRDAEYQWRVEAWRGGVRVAGPTWSFRTPPLPPATLSYADRVFRTGRELEWIPEYAGGRASYSIDPTLPEGLFLDPASGIITGMPTAALDSSRYEVTAANAMGRVKAVAVMRIVPPPPLVVRIPESMREAEILHILLVKGDSTSILYAGAVPDSNVLRLQSDEYAGGEAEILLHGRIGNRLEKEFRYRINREPPLQDSLPPYALPMPRDPRPEDGAQSDHAISGLAFGADAAPVPIFPPRFRIYLGLANPPPLFKDTLPEPACAPGVLLPDTVYYWRAETVRAGKAVRGPLWSFRTRPLAPGSLAYPQGKVFRLGVADSLVPAYSGGRARFRIVPDLPAGLRLDSLTGRISGTPSDTAAHATYSVTASNAAGSLEAKAEFRAEYRLIRIALPEEAREADSAEAWLLGAAGNIQDTLWDGALPDDLQVARASAHYDGVRSAAHVVCYRKGLAIREYRYGLTGPAAVAASLPLPALAYPSNPSPAETTTAADTLVSLAWSLAPGLPPSPRYRVYLGLSDPPPLYRDSLSRDGVDSVALAADTLYHWRVEYFRAGRSQMGPTWTFRTRPRKPVSLAYADIAFNVEDSGSVQAVYAGGGRARFTVSPSLPAGLSIDSRTGSIYGRPEAVAAFASYIVTAANPSGAVEGVVNLEVKPCLLDFLLPDTTGQSGRVLIELHDSTGALIETIWDGPPPPDLRVRLLVPAYLGGEASLRIQDYRGSVLHWESFRRVNKKLGVFAPAEAPALPATPKLKPTDNALTEDSVVDLTWSAAGLLTPPAMGAVYLGLANPPPLYRDSILDLYLESVALKPDTTYYWYVESVRAGRRTPGSVWTFRTPATPPSLLKYPAADSVLMENEPASLAPAWKSGRGTRFSVSPALPPGLALDSLTGVISGTPVSPSARSTWLVTLENGAGSLQTDVVLRVAPAARVVARWNGEEGSGTLLKDASGNGYDGTLANMAWVPGVKGMAFSFDGTAQAKIDVRDALKLNGFTISLWFKEKDQTRVQPLLEYSEEGWMMGINVQTNTTGWGVLNPGNVCANVRPSDASPEQHGSVRERNLLWTEAGRAALGRWSHAAVTFDPSKWKARIYLNGRLEIEKDLQPDFQPLAKGRIYLGFRPADFQDNNTEQGYLGQMDEITIYDGPLGAGAIDALYRSESP